MLLATMHPRCFTLDSLEPRQMFATLSAGVTVTSSIAAVGQQQTWTLPLVSGRQVTIAAGDTGTTSFATEMSLINPSGTVIATSSGDKGAFINLSAPVSGTYTVRVRDVGNNQTGGFKITSFYYKSSITDNDDAFAAESGRRRAATIGPGDLDVWTLTAASGQFLSALASENKVGDPIGIGLILVAPNGKVVSQKTSTLGAKIDVQGSVAGNYYAIVYEPGQDATGRYGISFARAPGAQYTGDPDTATPLPANTTRAGDLPGGDIDIFGVSITAGKKITATVTRTTGSLDPEILLVNATGKVVASINGSTSAVLTYTATTTGSYWLVVRDREADDGGQYTIKYTLT